MGKRNIQWAVLLMGMLGCVSCVLQNFHWDPQEQTLASSSGTYYIDAQTILQSLDRGNGKAFVEPLDPLAPTPTSSHPVEWRQEDYYRVAEELAWVVWQSPLEIWKLHSILYRVQCEDVFSGPQIVSFDLFKTVPGQRGDSRVERNIHINAKHDYVWWSEIEYFPNIFQKSALDLDQVSVSAEEALRISEEQGGQEIRRAVGDECEVWGSLVTGVTDGNWRVTCSSLDGAKLWEIQIDAVNGEYEIVIPE